MPNSSWSDCKKVLSRWPRGGLMELVHHLFELSPENAAAIVARTAGEADRGLLEDFRRRLVRALAPDTPRDPNFAEARRILRQYGRATDDAAGHIELIVSAVEACLEHVENFGAYERIVDFLYSLTEELGEYASIPEGLAHLEAFRGRLVGLRGRAGIGYGFDSELEGLLARCRWIE